MRSVTAFFLLAWPTLGSAQNLIPFPSFDSSSDLTNGWGNLGPGKVWSSNDVDNSPTSGSLLIINDRVAGVGVLVFSPCVAVTEGRSTATEPGTPCRSSSQERASVRLGCSGTTHVVGRSLEGTSG
jgi:hypothetical protein